MHIRIKVFYRLLVVVLALNSLVAFGQFETASLVGKVTDVSGSIIPGAKVTATNLATNVTITRVTNSDGEYNIPSLRPGAYRVEAERSGFVSTITQGVQVDVGTTKRIDVKLTAGQTETVTVDADALELETDSTQKQTVISAKELEAFPLLNMDYTDLIALSTGAIQDDSAQDLGTTSTAREGGFNINGQRSTFNNYILDGIDNNAHNNGNVGFSNQVILPPQFSNTQFSIVTTVPSAEYGRSAGGTINVAFKSGANAFHGTAYESIRNSVTNANGYFLAATSTGLPQRSTIIRNQFGGNIGGPIKKGKYFFFADYEGLRQVRGVVNITQIFSASQHQLIVSPNASVSTTVLNPFTGATYPAGLPLPRSVLSPIALSILDAFPLPNVNSAGITSTTNNYAGLQRFLNSADKEDLRLDAQWSPRMSGFLRVSNSKEHDLDGPILPEPLSTGNGYFRTTNQQVAIGLTRQIRNAELLELRLGTSYSKGSKQPITLGDPRTFGIQGLPQTPGIGGGLSYQSISGLNSFGRQLSNPQWQYPFFFNPKATYSILLGKNNLKTGYELSYLREIVQDSSPIYGSATYDGAFSGYDVADFLFGAPNSIALTNLFVAHLRQGGHAAFIQDDYKILPRVTVNVGVRYEYASHFYEKDGRLSNFNPTVTPVTGQLQRAALSGSAYQKQLVQPVLDDFMPRFGIAATLTPKLVAHLGYGISYVHFSRSGESDDLAVNGPQVNAAVYVQTPAHTKTGLIPTPTFFSLDNGFPKGMADPGNFNLFTSTVKWIPTGYKDPYVQSFYTSLQTGFGKYTLLDVAYVGNHAVKLQEVGVFNQRTPDLGINPSTGNFSRPLSNLADVQETYNGGMSNYNSLQIRLQSRGYHGLFVLNAFTYARDFGNVGDTLTSSRGFSGSPQDYYRPQSNDYGPLQYDIPVLNTTAVQYVLPIGRGGLLFRNAGKRLDNLIGGWQITTYNKYNSGPALTPTYSPTNAQLLSTTGGVHYRPYLASSVAVAHMRLHIPGHPEQAFCNTTLANSTQANYNGCTVGFSTTNPNPLPTPANPTLSYAGTVNDPRGNVSDGFLRGDFLDQLDAGVNKTFSLPGERYRLQVRGQFFNVLNKTNFAPPSMTCCTTQFGQITSTFTARQAQLQAIVMF